MSNKLQVSLRLKAAVDGLKEISALIDEVEELGGETSSASKKTQTLAKNLTELSTQQKLIDQFKSLKKESVGIAGALEKAQNEARLYAQGIKKSEQPSAKLNKQLADARQRVRALKEEQNKHNAVLQKNRAQLKQSGISTKKLADAQARITKDTAKAKQGIDGLNKKLNENKQQLKANQSATKKFGSGVSGLTKKIVALGGTYLGLGALKKAFNNVIGTGAKFEQLQVQINSLMGGIEAGESATVWIKEFARNTPASLDAVTQGFVKLKAFGIDPMDGAYQSIVDQTAKLGFSQEKLDGVILAVGQAWTKQKLQGEEALQLIERGVPVWDLLAEATGRNVVELQKLSTQGKLGRKEIKLLLDQMGKSSIGAAREQMSTWNGLWSNMTDVFTNFVNDIAQNGVLDYFKQQLTDLKNKAEELASSGELERYAKAIADFMVGGAKAVKGLITTLVDLAPVISFAAKTMAGWKIIQFTQNILGASGTLRSKLIPSIVETGKALKGGVNQVGGFRSALKSLPTIVKVGIAVQAAEGIQSIAEFVKTTFDLVEAKRSIAEIEKQNETLFKKNIAIGQQMTEQNKAYKDTLHLTANELEQLNEVEKKAYREKLEKQKEYYRGQVKILVHQQALGEQVTVDEAKIRQALNETNQALTKLDDTFKQTSDTAKNTVARSVNAIVKQFDELQNKQNDVAESLSTIFKDIDLTRPQAVQELLDAMTELETSGKATAQELQTALGGALDKIATEDLSKFNGAVKFAMSEAGVNAKTVGDALNASLGSAFRRLNLDAEKYASGMSTAGKRAIEAFDQVAQGANGNAQIIKDALESTVSSISTQKGAEEIQKRVAQLVEANLISAKEALTIIDMLKPPPELQNLQNDIQNAKDLSALNVQREKNLNLMREGVITQIQFQQNTENIIQKQQELETQIKQVGSELENAGEKGKDGLDETKQSADGATGSLKAMSGAASVVGAFLGAAKQRLTALSEAAYNIFLNRMGMGGAIQGADDLQAKLDAANNKLQELKLSALTNTGGVSSFLNKIATEATIVERNFYEQKVAVENLTDRIKNGAYPASSLLRLSADKLRDRFNLLGKQQLSGLISELKRAQDRVRSLKRDASDTLRSIKSELAELNGDYEAVAKAQAEQKQREIESKLKEAKATGDAKAISDLQQALNIQKQIGAKRIQEARERKADEQRENQEAKRERDDENSRPATTPRQETSQQPEQSIQRVYQVDLTTRSGKRSEVTGSPESIENLIEHFREEQEVAQ